MLNPVTLPASGQNCQLRGEWLNSSTSPSLCGRSAVVFGVVIVFLMPSRGQTSPNTAALLFCPWSLCSSSGAQKRQNISLTEWSAVVAEPRTPQATLWSSSWPPRSTSMATHSMGAPTTYCCSGVWERLGGSSSWPVEEGLQSMESLHDPEMAHPHWAMNQLQDPGSQAGRPSSCRISRSTAARSGWRSWATVREEPSYRWKMSAQGGRWPASRQGCNYGK